MSAPTTSRFLPRGAAPGAALVLLLALCQGPAAAQDLALHAARLVASEYRQSLGRADVAISLESLDRMLPATERGNNGLPAAAPSLTLGLRYRVTERHLLFVDATTPSLGAESAAALVSAKVGMEWKPSKSRAGFEQGALGLQLDSGYRLSLKARRGGPALYLRSRF